MAKTRITAMAAGVVLAAVVLSGCSGSGNESASSAGDAAAPQLGDAQPKGDTAGSTGQAAPKDKGGAPAQPALTRAIVKTGSLTIEHEDIDKQRQAAISVVTGLRGQVASEDTGSRSDGRITRANLVLKVPTAAYETAIERLSALGKRTAIHQESTDVTEQVVDVDSRIASQRASLERMRALLAKATTIAEIVSVESELTRREADLEALLAKQKALSGQTELATLSLVIVEPGKAPVEAKDDKGFLAGLAGGWNAFTATFVALATVLGALLPFLVALALIAVPLWRFRHRLRRTPIAAPSAPDPS
ncbi:hypothetical protein BWI15_17995 [Kribbella sp. ALI-6-A]|uniref:DUF4349 domain-containing protein n=1 Tax=Kribbella sp. ALI-6-A TaxID=1933817 RepID=UPI00097C9733|nr:DUF4349 domain-containing protein [Kribbella sp. ALI-6-A]ONI71989.1 hypothetical protein BWI15_17995 [Kribbella sp. ALI-6-A]